MKMISGHGYPIFGSYSLWSILICSLLIHFGQPIIFLTNTTTTAATTTATTTSATSIAATTTSATSIAATTTSATSIAATTTSATSIAATTTTTTSVAATSATAATTATFAFSIIITSIQTSTTSITQSTAIIPTTIPNNVPPVVSSVTVDNSTIIINGSNVTLTLSWGEPFNIFNPIVSYTVSCSGDAQCPPNFTTTDNTTGRYTIHDLTPMTNYTFSVVATNSIGSGEAGVWMLTTPPAIHQVIGIELSCQPVGLINQCIVMWNPVTQGDITGYQVHYNGTRINVNSSTTTITFIAPSLPDGEHDGVVMVMVIATNQFGVGPESDSEFATVTASSVINAVTILNAPNATNELHSITVTCTIHLNSTADQCVVMAMADGRINTTGSAPIIDGMAVVTVNSLHCEMTYNITAEGRDYNGTLMGPGSSYNNITTGLCPGCESDDELSTELIIIISVVITFIITLVITALITYIITSLCNKRRCKTVEFKKIEADNSDKNDTKQSFQPDDNSQYENIPTIKRVQAGTEPEYATTTAVTVDTSNIRMDSNPAYVATNL